MEKANDPRGKFQGELSRKIHLRRGNLNSLSKTNTLQDRLLAYLGIPPMVC